MKQIKCAYYQYPVRDAFDNLYTCKWKVDGSGIKLPVNSKIEIVIVGDSGDSEESDTSDFREQQSSAINVYNTKLKVTLEKLKVWMDDNRLQENTLDKKRQGGRVRNAPDRYGNNNFSLTVKTLVVRNNNSSAISVMTVDNAITNHSVGIVNDSNCFKTMIIKIR